MTAYILNLADLFCTLYALHIGVPELNPLMRSIPAMVTYKVAIVGALCCWLSSRPERIARYGLTICTVVYAVLTVWHCVGIFTIS